MARADVKRRSEARAFVGLLVAVLCALSSGASARGPAPSAPAVVQRYGPSSTDGESDLSRRVRLELASLGSMSLGRPNAGALVNGVRMPEGKLWHLEDPARAWGTQETIDAIIDAISLVERRHPGSHSLAIGHLSRPQGGPIRPHRSHQSGRDADLGYYYLDPERGSWYRRAAPQNLDRARTWALVRHLLTRSDVEYMFIDASVQRMLREHALSIGEQRAWLDRVFQLGGRDPEPIIRHTWGHATHIHVRFYSPRAQRLGHRAFDALAAADRIAPDKGWVRWRATSDRDVGWLARRFGISESLILRANGLRSLTLRAGRSYFVPLWKVRRTPEPVMRQRRLPPGNKPSGGSAVAGRTASAPRPAADAVP
jgi:penicillin-insensitive murein endopeptidase